MKRYAPDAPTLLERRFNSLPKNWSHAERMRILKPRRGRREWFPTHASGVLPQTEDTEGGGDRE